MAQQIVQLVVTEQAAALPLTLQGMGAAISQGSTTVPTNTYSLLTQPSDLTPLLGVGLSISSMVWSAGTVLVTTSVNISGLSTGDMFWTTISGATATGYNGTYFAMVTSANTFTFALAVNPGSETVPGTYSPPNQSELLSMVTTFFGQGSTTSLYVLELGAGDQTEGPGQLAVWITANPLIFYIYLAPRPWDNQAAFLSLVQQFESPSGMTYFFTTTTTGTYTNYTARMKSVLSLIEAPAVTPPEFSLAAPFQVALSYNPGPAGRMTPFAYKFLYGVTNYPLQGNNALLTEIATANCNVVGTGAQGGISNAILWNGKTEDGNDFGWWYAADWIQLHGVQALANAIINGNNNPFAPVNYNQQGVTTLQNVLFKQFKTAVAYNLAYGGIILTQLDPVTFGNNLQNDVYAGNNVINAVPCATYVALNPGAYAAKNYGGLSCVFIPQTGFDTIVMNLLVTNLLSQ
jgi:hypothetical protein